MTVSNKAPLHEIQEELGTMTLRDRFAAAALTGYLAMNSSNERYPRPEKVALMAYEYADAMLLEREK
jgi:hypothetical protein